VSGRTAAFGRQRWRDLVGQVRAAAAEGLHGRPLPRHAQSQLEVALTRTGAAPLPVAPAQAEAARTAFATAARALLAAVASRPEKARLALVECDAVEALLDAQATADSQVWQRQFGD
jgi:hypothetical protein